MIDATIIARHWKRGRGAAVRLVVLHTTENPCAPGVARKVAEWFASAGAPEASAHYVVGPDELIACVSEENTAWHAPPVNDYAIGVEHTARASWSAPLWASPDAAAMLDRSAELVADICARHDIPIVFVDRAGLLVGGAGITTHAEVSAAFHKSDHTDPGASFPLGDYLVRVARFALTSGGETPSPTGTTRS